MEHFNIKHLSPVGLKDGSCSGSCSQPEFMSVKVSYHANHFPKWKMFAWMWRMLQTLIVSSKYTLYTALFVGCFQGSYKQDEWASCLQNDHSSWSLWQRTQTSKTFHVYRGGAFDTKKHHFLVEHHLMHVNMSPYTTKVTLTDKWGAVAGFHMTVLN